MTNVSVVIKPNCTYCKKLLGYVNELMDSGVYTGVNISYIQAGSSRADFYDYYYLPAVFIGTQRLIHGACKRQDVQRVLQQAQQCKKG